MIARCLFIFLFIFLFTSCIRSNEDQEILRAKICCLNDLYFHSNYGGFAPDAIRITLVDCDSAMIEGIVSVIFPHIVIKDNSFIGLWDREIQYQDTMQLFISTNYFEGKNLSKDSIVNLLSEQIGLITSKNDTIYVEPCGPIGSDDE